MSHPAMSVRKRLGAIPHVRKFFQIVGFSSPHNFLVHNSSLNNLVRGVLTRVFYVKGQPTPKPLEGIYSLRLRYFRDRLFKLIPSTTPLSLQDTVNLYRGRKKDIYQAAHDSLLNLAVSRADSNLKVFVKAEFINSDDKPDPDPRIISPRDPRYNLEVGKFLLPLEKTLYRAIARLYGEPTVMKGYNANETGKLFATKWLKYRRPVAVGLDASRFDQHVSKQALQFEHSVYNGVF